MDTMKTILFIDLDDTILQGPLETVVFPYIFGEFAKYRPDLDDEIFRMEMIDILESRYADKRVDAFDWDELIHMVALKFDIPVKLSVEELIVKYAREPHIRIHDHVMDTLIELKKDPKRTLAVTSNGFWRYQQPTVKSLGLLPFFDYILTPDMMQCLKGEKRFYQHTLDGNQVRITIGDRYDADVEWPKDLGFNAIWKPTEIPPEIDLSQSPVNRVKSLRIPAPYQHKPDAIVQGFDEVIEAVKAIENLTAAFPF